MEEEGSVPPLPQRVPGATKGSWPATRPARPVLSESVLRRVRAAMDAQTEQPASQKQAASSERPASLPRPATGANNGPRPTAEVARAPLSAFLLGRVRDADDDTSPIPVISGSAGSEIESLPDDETSAELDRAARAQRAKALRAAKAFRAAKAEHAVPGS